MVFALVVGEDVEGDGLLWLEGGDGGVGCHAVVIED